MDLTLKCRSSGLRFTAREKQETCEEKKLERSLVICIHALKGLNRQLFSVLSLCIKSGIKYEQVFHHNKKIQKKKTFRI
jgi:hypothetical protein